MNEIARAIAKLGGTGIINAADLPDLETQRGRVALLMLDGQWHRAPDIIVHAGGSEGLRRLRELREIKGIEIERRRCTSARVFEYRLTVDRPEIAQAALF